MQSVNSCETQYQSIDKIVNEFLKKQGIKKPQFSTKSLKKEIAKFNFIDGVVSKQDEMPIQSLVVPNKNLDFWKSFNQFIQSNWGYRIAVYKYLTQEIQKTGLLNKIKSYQTIRSEIRSKKIQYTTETNQEIENLKSKQRKIDSSQLTNTQKLSEKRKISRKINQLEDEYDKKMDEWDEELKSTMLSFEEMFHYVLPLHGQRLGKGSYGIVYRSLWNASKDKNILLFPLAMKMEFALEPVDKRVADEARCHKLTGNMVVECQSPHFPLYFSHFATKDFNSDYHASFGFLELADGSLENLIETKSHLLNNSILFSAYFQTIQGIVFMALKHGITHHDLYLRNVLYNFLDEGVSYYYQYRMGDQMVRYHLQNVPLLAKITDFGFCTREVGEIIVGENEKQTTFSTKIHYSAYVGNQPYEGWKITQALTPHVNRLRLPYYAYDILSFTIHFLDFDQIMKNSKFSPFVDYLRWVLDKFDLKLSTGMFDTAEGLVEFMVSIFGKKAKLEDLTNDLKINVDSIIPQQLLFSE